MSPSRRVWTIGFMLILVLFAGFLYRDLHLSKKAPLRESVPEIVVEHLVFERKIDGRVWHVRIGKAENQGSLSKGQSVDVTVTDGAGSRWDLLAAGALYADEAPKWTLFDVKGTFLVDHRGGHPKRIHLVSPQADYLRGEAIWAFPKGLHVSDDVIDLVGGTGRLDEKGHLWMQKGVQARWETR